MVDSIFGYGIRPGPIGLSVKAGSPTPWLYTHRRKDLVKVFELAQHRNHMKASIMPPFRECSKDMVLFLKRVLGSYSKNILGNYTHKFRSKLYKTKPLSTYVVYKLNDKLNMTYQNFVTKPK